MIYYDFYDFTGTMMTFHTANRLKEALEAMLPFGKEALNDSQCGDFCIFSKVAALTGKECDLWFM